MTIDSHKTNSLGEITSQVSSITKIILSFLKKATNVFDITDSHLTLKGLKLIFEKNEQRKKRFH